MNCALLQHRCGRMVITIKISASQPFDVAAHFLPRLWFLAFVIHNFFKKMQFVSTNNFFQKIFKLSRNIFAAHLKELRGPPVEKRWFRLASFPIVPFHISVLFSTFSLKVPRSIAGSLLLTLRRASLFFTKNSGYYVFAFGRNACTRPRVWPTNFRLNLYDPHLSGKHSSTQPTSYTCASIPSQDSTPK